MSDLSALLASNSPMGSPIGVGGGGGQPMQQQQQAQQRYYAQPPPQQQQHQQPQAVQYMPDEYDEMGPPMAQQQPRQRMQPQTQQSNMMSALLDDPDKRATLLVFALLVLAQQAQTRDAARSLSRAVGVQIADTPYEPLVISVAAACGFFYYLHTSK